MAEHEKFVERVIQNLPSSPPSSFLFRHWPYGGRPTEEAMGLMPFAGVDPEKFIAAVMDVDHYVGNIEHVAECRAIADARFSPPEHVRFYQRINLPLLGTVHHELVLHRMGVRNGCTVAAWDLLRAETDKLDPKKGFRSDYNHGAWVVMPGVVGYCLGSAPKRDDVGFLKWKVLTTGADAAAPAVLKGNVEGMARWSARRS
jgi:hypothetical protein